MIMHSHCLYHHWFRYRYARCLNRVRAALSRRVLSDAQWAIMEPYCLGPYCLGKVSDPGQTGRDPRLVVDAVLWIVRTGAQWRELANAFGKWNSVFRRFRRGVRADTFQRMFKELASDADLEYAMIDATIVKVHRSGQGAKGGLFAKPLDVPVAA